MSKPTPGPWEWSVDRFRGGYSGITGPDGSEVLFPNTANDGDTGAAWFEDFPSDADRALIAAAPAMGEALLYVAERILAQHVLNEFEAEGLAKARAALAAAGLAPDSKEDSR